MAGKLTRGDRARIPDGRIARVRDITENDSMVRVGFADKPAHAHKTR